MSAKSNIPLNRIRELFKSHSRTPYMFAGPRLRIHGLQQGFSTFSSMCRN